MKTNNKAFTLIELLIVVAIIGILAGIILVNIISARNRARDAAIMETSQSLMKLAQVDSAVSGDYSNWEVVRVYDTDTCNSYFGSVSNPAAAQQACSNMFLNSGGACHGGTLECIFMTSAGGSFPKLSLMVWLPGRQQYYCVGSNGRSSVAPETMAGVPDYLSPGCPFDPEGNGS